QAAQLSGDLRVSKCVFVESIDVQRTPLNEPCHIAVSEPDALIGGAIRKGFVAKLVEILKIGLRLFAAEKNLRRVGVKTGAAQFHRELFETERMAAFLAGVGEDRGGQYLGPLALQNLAKTDIFEIGKRVQPPRVKGGIRDDLADQAFKAIIARHRNSHSNVCGRRAALTACPTRKDCALIEI